MWSLLAGLVQVANGIVGYLDRRGRLTMHKKAALFEVLGETQEVIEYARSVDVDTADLSRDARERVRDAIRRNPD